MPASNMIITLNAVQSEISRFPVSCQVTALDMNISGTVRMVQIDLLSSDRGNLYVLESSQEDVEPIPERSLSFAPTCMVWFEGSQAALILAAYRPPNSQDVVYSVRLDDGGIFHGVTNEQLKFREEQPRPAIPYENIYDAIHTVDVHTQQSQPEEVQAFEHVLPTLIEREKALNCIIFLQLPFWMSVSHVQNHLNTDEIINCPYIQIFPPNLSQDPLCPPPCKGKPHICLASTSMAATSLASQVVQEQLGDSLEDHENVKFQRDVIEWDVRLESSEPTVLQQQEMHLPIAASTSSRTINISHWFGNLDLLNDHMQRARNFLELQTDCTITTTFVARNKLGVTITGKDGSSLATAGRFVENSILSQVDDVLHCLLLYEMAQTPGEDSAVYQRSSVDSEKKVWMAVVPIPNSLPSSSEKAVEAIIANDGITQILRDTGSRVKIKYAIKDSIPPFVYIEGTTFPQVEKAELMIVEKMMSYVDCTSNVDDTAIAPLSGDRRSPERLAEDNEPEKKKSKLTRFSRDYEIPSWYGGTRISYLNLLESKASLEARAGCIIQICREKSPSGNSLVIVRLNVENEADLDKAHSNVVDELLAVVAHDIRGVTYHSFLVGRLRYLWCRRLNGEAVKQAVGVEGRGHIWLLVVELGGIDKSEIGAVLGIDGKKRKMLESIFRSFIFLVPHSSPFIYIEGIDKEQVEAVGRLIQRSKARHAGISEHEPISLL